MRKLKFTLDRRSLETIYFTFIRPILEYGDVIWNNCTLNDKQELDKIQNEAARIVSGATQLVSISDLYHETGWEVLETRRKKHRLILLYKMINDQSPNYLSSLVPPLVGQQSKYNFRNSDLYQTIPARTNLYSHSFLPSVIQEWNCLPIETRTSDSLQMFKRHLNRGKVYPPPK